MGGANNAPMFGCTLLELADRHGLLFELLDDNSAAHGW